MTIVKFAVVSLALAGFSVAYADNSPSNSKNNRRSTGNTESAPVELEKQAGWALQSEGDSSILQLASTVVENLKKRGIVTGEPYITPVRVEMSDLEERAAHSDGADCRVMPIPGSRIRQMRCYFPTEGEQALNQYQFQEEIRYTIRQQEIAQMELMEQQRALYDALQTDPVKTLQMLGLTP